MKTKTKELTLNDIIKNEHCKRAAEVALAGRHSIAFFGPGTVPGQMAAWMQQAPITLPVRAVAFCPCGHHESWRGGCNCSVAKIRRWQSGALFLKALACDMHIQTSEIGGSDAEQWERRQGEPDEEVFARIEAAAANKMPSLRLTNQFALDLLRSYVNAKGADRVPQAKAIARTVARLAGKDVIEAAHLAEAFQYQWHPS